MKQQVARLSPHQNAKMMAVLMAILSLVFILPFALIGSLLGMGPARGSVWMFIVVPILYFVVTYVMFAIWCALYNALAPVIGGFEYEAATPVN